MSAHRLTESALTRAVHHAYVTAVWNAVGLLLGAFFLIWKLDSRWTVLFFIGPVLLIGVWNGIRRAEAAYRTYEIELDDTAIARRYRGLERERIHYSEIGPVIELEGEGLFIRSLDGKHRIAVSDGVSEYADIRGRIASLVPIERAPHRRTRVQTPGVVIVSLAMLITAVTFATADDPLVVAGTGGALIMVLAIATVLLLRNRRLIAGKIALALVMLAVAAVIAARIFLILTGAAE